MEELEYYKELSRLQAKVIAETPCDPDITQDQIKAVQALEEFQKHVKIRRTLRART